MRIIRNVGQFPILDIEKDQKEKGLFRGMIVENRVVIKAKKSREKLTQEERDELKKVKKAWKRTGENRNSVNFKHGLQSK